LLSSSKIRPVSEAVFFKFSMLAQIPACRNSLLFILVPTHFALHHRGDSCTCSLVKACRLPLNSLIVKRNIAYTSRHRYVAFHDKAVQRDLPTLAVAGTDSATRKEMRRMIRIMVNLKSDSVYVCLTDITHYFLNDVVLNAPFIAHLKFCYLHSNSCAVFYAHKIYT
jgi:hypothetical protein